jgi:protein-tyrosine phosphatase
MELPIDTTPKPKFLIVNETNIDKINALVKEQLNLTDETYVQKAQQKHPTKELYNVPMLDFVKWEIIISEITCEQVMELSSDWIKFQEKIN